MAVSFVDPVLVEVAAGFRLLRGVELAPVFGLTMGKTVGVGAGIVLPLLGPFAGHSKIDQFSHAAPDGMRILIASGACMAPVSPENVDILAASRLPVSKRGATHRIRLLFSD